MLSSKLLKVTNIQPAAPMDEDVVPELDEVEPAGHQRTQQLMAFQHFNLNGLPDRSRGDVIGASCPHLVGMNDSPLAPRQGGQHVAVEGHCLSALCSPKTCARPVVISF
eukprot:Skav219856  [mRNA]  locus=scaffold859:788624:788950:- [translate_table: standard]